MNSDFKDLLLLLAEEQVEYLVIGGYAVIYHSQPRSTKDLDIWLKPSEGNSYKIEKVFRKFGLPFIGVTRDDFANEGLQYAVGRPPCQLDFLTSVPGLDFEDCWSDRVEAQDEGVKILFLGKADLIRSKEVAGRLQDLADIDELNRVLD